MRNDDSRKHPIEHKLSAYYHRMTLIRTLTPILMLIIQTIVLFLQVTIASKIFNIPISEVFHLTTLISIFSGRPT